MPFRGRQNLLEFNPTPNTPPSLAMVLQTAIEQRLANVHTAIPAHVTKYNSDNTVDVQIDLLRKNNEGILVTVPVIPKVPILLARASAGSAGIQLPIKSGDTGFLIFCERSLDNWLVNGGVVNPDDFRKFDYSDGVFVPGLYPYNNEPPVSSNYASFYNDKMVISLDKDGKLSITGSTGELMTIISTVLQTLIGSTVITPPGATIIGAISSVPPSPAGTPVTTGMVVSITTTTPSTGQFDPGTVSQLQQEKDDIDGMTI